MAQTFSLLAILMPSCALAHLTISIEKWSDLKNSKTKQQALLKVLLLFVGQEDKIVTDDTLYDRIVNLLSNEFLVPICRLKCSISPCFY